MLKFPSGARWWSRRGLQPELTRQIPAGGAKNLVVLKSLQSVPMHPNNITTMRYWYQPSSSQVRFDIFKKILRTQNHPNRRSRNLSLEKLVERVEGYHQQHENQPNKDRTSLECVVIEMISSFLSQTFPSSGRNFGPLWQTTWQLSQLGCCLKLDYSIFSTEEEPDENKGQRNAVPSGHKTLLWKITVLNR